MDFFDTSILVYTADPRDLRRRAIARQLLRAAVEDESFALSVQVMQEFYNVVTSKRYLPHANAVAALRAWSRGRIVVATTPELLWNAMELRERWQFSIWDALVVQAALDAGCTRLITEDLQHGQRIGELEIFNPFLAPPAVHEPAAEYAVKARKPRSRKSSPPA